MRPLCMLLLLLIVGGQLQAQDSTAVRARPDTLPPVTSRSPDLFRNLTVVEGSEAAGARHTALPVLSSHMTRLLSSCPPRLAR